MPQVSQLALGHVLGLLASHGIGHVDFWIFFSFFSFTRNVRLVLRPIILSRHLRSVGRILSCCELGLHPLIDFVFFSLVFFCFFASLFFEDCSPSLFLPLLPLVETSLDFEFFPFVQSAFVAREDGVDGAGILILILKLM